MRVRHLLRVRATAVDVEVVNLTPTVVAICPRCRQQTMTAVVAIAFIDGQPEGIGTITSCPCDEEDDDE